MKNATIRIVVCFVLSALAAGCFRERGKPPQCENGVDCEWVSVAHSDSLGCATWGDGTMACWGAYSDGVQTVKYGDNPLRLAIGVDVQRVTVSPDGICVIGHDTSVWCWGDNSLGIVGDGSTDFRDVPRRVDGVSGAQDICLGYTLACSVLLDGSVLCWGIGENRNGPPHEPEVLAVPEAVVEISCFAMHFCSRTSSGVVYCWGDLPLSSSLEWSAPVEIVGIQDVNKISAGKGHACALTGAGAASCWGRNAFGRLGDGTTLDATQPVVVEGDHVFTEISAGDTHTCAVDEMGLGWCWGEGFSGALGNGSSENQLTPVQVSNLAGVVRIESSAYTTLAVLRDGSIWGWGDAQYLAYEERNLVRGSMYNYVDEPALLRNPLSD